MSHVLVKWMNEDTWDVYPLRGLLYVKTARELVRNPELVHSYVGKAFDIDWKEEKEPSPAYLIAVGDEKKMEKRRSGLAAMTLKGRQTQSEDSCDEYDIEIKRLRVEVKELREANTRLEGEPADAKEELKNKKANNDAVKVLKRLRGLVRFANNPPSSRTPTTEDIGHGVHVPINTMERLKATYKGACAAASFARNLHRAVFTDEELRGKSLHGMQSNVCSDKPPKPALDERRRDAVIDYTCGNFNVSAVPIKGSLASLLLVMEKGRN